VYIANLKPLSDPALAMTISEEGPVLSTRLFALLLLLLIVSHAIAQAPMPNDMPLEVSKEAAPPSGFTTTATKPTPLPDAPTPHRVIDKKFIAVMGALGGAETLRFTSRKLVLDNEYAAGAPWVTSVPSNQHVIAMHAGIYAAELFVAYELKRRHSWLPGDKVVRKLWWAYPAAMATIHIKNGVGNIRTQGPGGCTSMQCAEQQMQ
jgi:hypothetical protein